MWNPSTCECQCDIWCKPGQYLDHKNCVCKNKLIGRVTEETTRVINETMINNKDKKDNDSTTYIFIGLFLIVIFIYIIIIIVILFIRK